MNWSKNVSKNFAKKIVKKIVKKFIKKICQNIGQKIHPKIGQKNSNKKNWSKIDQKNWSKNSSITENLLKLKPQGISASKNFCQCHPFCPCQSRFLEAPLVRQAYGELKNP